MHPTATPPALGTEAMTAIEIFSVQMREMTDLACRMHADMAGKLAASEARMQAAAKALADGEARIGERMAEFSRMAGDVADAADRQTIALQAAMQEALRRTSDMAAEAVKPLKAEAQAAASQVADSGLALRAETETLLAHMKQAGATFNSRAEAAVKLQTERLAEAVGNAFLASQAKLGQTAEALNTAAAALAGRVLAQTEAQAAQSAELAVMADHITRFAAALPDVDGMIRREAMAEATVRRMETAAEAVKAVGGGLAETAVQLQGAAVAVSAAAQERQQAGARAAQDHADGIKELAGSMREGFTRLAAERNDITTEILTRIDEVAERIKVETRENAAAGGLSGARQVFDAERASITRLSAAFRLVMRDMSSENTKLGDVVQALATSVEQVRARIEELHVPAPVAQVHAGPAHQPPSPDGLPDIRSETQSLRRLLVGFRLLMKDVGGEAIRLRQSVNFIAATALPTAPQPVPADTARIDAISGEVAGLSTKLDDVLSAMAALQTQAEGPKAVHAAEKDSLQRLLMGFRLLLRDLSGEVEALRGKVSAITAPPAANDVDTDPAQPLREVASQISTGVAETLAALEVRLDEPLARLTEATAESAKLLQVAHQAMAAPAKRVTADAPIAAEALDDAIARIERAAGMIDTRVAGVDRLAAQLKRQGSGGEPTLATLIGDLQQVTADLRAESGDFLAVSAALSRDLERATGAAEAPVRDAAMPRAAKMKKRAA
jgi:hypothetical protein